jgi:hypothetical protein
MNPKYGRAFIAIMLFVVCICTAGASESQRLEVPKLIIIDWSR